MVKVTMVAVRRLAMVMQAYDKGGAISQRDVWDALKQLAPRRPADPSPVGAKIHWELVDIDRYRVMCGARTAGFIDVVGAVFVVLAGERYDRATEVTQTLVFARAVDVLVPPSEVRPERLAS
jgi:hypothetical protein